jgi:hypothetical protein
LLPHFEHRAQRRSTSLDARPPQRIISGASAFGARTSRSGNLPILGTVYGETEMEALQEAYKQFDVKTEAERRRIYLRSQ